VHDQLLAAPGAYRLCRECGGMSTLGGLSPNETRDTARCPHVVYRDVLGAALVAALLDYAVLHRDRFRPAPVRSRGIAQEAVDSARRDGLLLGDLGPLRAPIEAFEIGRAHV